MDTIRITIKGGQLTAPVEITDQQAIAPFHVGAGPGNVRVLPDGSRVPNFPAQCFIVDWSRGTTELPKGLPVYEISFVTTRTDRSTYIVRYGIDQSTNEGYVYIPGNGDAAYADNVWMILRGVEGNWFHAWSAWEKLVHPLITNALKMR